MTCQPASKQQKSRTNVKSKSIDKLVKPSVKRGDVFSNITEQTLTIKPHALDVLLPYKNWGVSVIKYS